MDGYLFLHLSDLVDASALVLCSLLFLAATRLRLFGLAMIFVAIATVLDFLGGSANAFALVRFPLMWTVLILERIYPRNRYQIMGPESLKTASVYGFRQSLSTFVRYLAPALFTTPMSMSLNLKSSPVPFLAQVVLTALLADLSIYLIHRAQHHFATYWKFHKLHHATEELTLLVNFRTHIFEAVLVQMGSRILIYQILGVDAGVKTASVLLAYTTGGMLAHANLDFPKSPRWRWLNYLLVTPNFHALHHSIDGSHCNFGEAFPIWDLAFGTFKMPKEHLSKFGVDDRVFAAKSILAQHFEPFVSTPVPAIGIEADREQPIRQVS